MLRLCGQLLICLGLAAPALAQQGAPQLGGSQLALSAAYASDSKVIAGGLIWRVFRMDERGEPQLIVQSGDATPVLPVAPGEYVVHVAYGLAGSTRKVLVGAGTTTERVPLSAGGLSVRGSIADYTIPLTRLQISVFIPQPGASEGRLITSTLRSGEVLRLPEGTYHVVSSYGDSNSIVRADIRVTTGKVVEANMHHKAATITLKLVSNPGGEARANTAWSVLTPGGDVIREAIGAFPSMTLAEGEYLAIARNDGQVFQSEFKIRSGVDRDVEVLSENPVQTDAAASGQARPAPPRQNQPRR